MSITKHNVFYVLAAIFGGGWVVGVDQLGISPSGAVGMVWFVFMLSVTAAVAHLGGSLLLGWASTHLSYKVPEFIDFLVPYVLPYLLVLFLFFNFEPPSVFATDCSPNYHWQEGFEPTVDPRTKTPTAIRRIAVMPKSKFAYSMHILGAEGGLDNLNVGWSGMKEEHVRKWTEGGINLELRNPIGLVLIMITPRSMADTHLQIRFECLNDVPR